MEKATRKISGVSRIHEGKTPEEDAILAEMQELVKKTKKKIKVKYLPVEAIHNDSQLVYGTTSFQLDGIPSISFGVDSRGSREVSLSSTRISDKKQAVLFANILTEVAKYKADIFDYIVKYEEIREKLYR